MMTLNKQDVSKTLIIIWFVAATGYVIWDQYTTYKVRGIQAAYEQAYTDSVNQLITNVQSNGCQQATEIRKGDTKLNVIDAQCLTQQAGQQGATSSTSQQPTQNK